MKIKNDKLAIQIACLVVAVVLWMIVMLVTNQTLEDSYPNVSVTIRNLSALENSNLVMMQEKENITVTVKATGLTEQLNSISSRDFSAYIDVLGFKEGVSNAKVEVIGPSGVDVVSVYPSQIACNIEAVISKVMDVSVQFDGVHANNYYRAQTVPNPSSVKITGPRSVVNSADKAVATINIDGAAEDVIKTVPVRIYDDTDTEIFLSAPIRNVKVTVPIYPTKNVVLEPTVVGIPEEGYELVDVTVKPQRVRIAAEQDVLDTIKGLTLEELDITGAYNNILLTRNILNSEGLIFIDMETIPVVNAVVEKIIERELTYSYDEIQFINKSENSDVILEETEEEITVTVWGTSTLVNSLEKDDLILTLDLSETVTGKNTVKLECVSEFTFKEIALSKDTVILEILEPQEEE
ncbi:MAG: CdaR family protein [Tissierellia bacterium]|nr:CdaR family protein [Tissierellia bacterium]